MKSMKEQTVPYLSSQYHNQMSQMSTVLEDWGRLLDVHSCLISSTNIELANSQIELFVLSNWSEERHAACINSGTLFFNQPCDSRRVEFSELCSSLKHMSNTM